MPVPEAVTNCLKCGSPTASSASGGYCAACLFAGMISASETERVAQTDPGQHRGGARAWRLGDYQLLAEIARGGMGVVYKARHDKVQRVVALKMVLAGRFASDAELKRFRTETESVAQLDHPNIVPIFEVGEIEGQPYFTMKFIEGGNLSASLSTFHSSPLRGAELIATVARAVHHAHQRGILHRDLKPANILLDKNGCPFVTDFGLARQLEGPSELTLTGVVLGTPNFMAPEMAAGHARLVSTATDVYSLGAILYQIITNQPPFVAATQLETLKLVQESEVARPSSITLNVNRDLETICLKCLEKEPAKRYSSALALAEDLERWLRHESILARSSTALERGLKWVKRKPLVAALSGCVILSVIGGLAGILWQLHQTESARHEAVNLASAEKNARRDSQTAYRHTSALLTKIETEKANELLFRGDYSGGLAYLARVLRRDPGNSVAAARVVSVLQKRGFGVATVVRAQVGGRVMHASLSPTADRAIIGLNQGTARIWDSRTGLPLSPLMTHAKSILYTEFSPDGTKVVTTSEDGTARVWKGLSGVPLTPPLQLSAPVRKAQFSPSGSHLATISNEAVQIWDTVSGAIVFSLEPASPATAIQFSPDGTRIVTLCQDGTGQLWDARSGKPLAEPRFYGGSKILSLGPNGETIAVAFDEHKLALWTAASGAGPTWILNHDPSVTRAEFSGEGMLPIPGWSERPHGREITEIAFSGDGQILATSCADGHAFLWNALTGLLIASLEHATLPWPAGFSADNTRFLTIAFDNTARLWDARDGRPITETLRHEDRVVSARLSPDGETITSVCLNGSFYHWRALLPVHPYRDLELGFRPLTVRFSPDGRSILATSENGTVALLDARTGEPLCQPIIHGSGLVTAQFSPDSQRVATSGNDLETKIWDIKSGALIAGGLRQPGVASDLTFSADGRRLIALSRSGIRRIWNTQEWQPIGENILREPGLVIRSVRISRDGRMLLILTGSNDARLYDAGTGQRIGAAMEHSDLVSGGEFSRDGKKVITCSNDNTARIWEVPTGKLLTPPLRHGLHVYAVDLSPDGRKAVTCGPDRRARIWDAVTGASLSAPLEHLAPVNYAEFSSDGSHLLTTCLDESVHLWDVNTGQKIAERIRLAGGLQAAHFSPDGQMVLVASMTGQIRLMPLPFAQLPVPRWLPDLAEALAGQKINEADQSQPLDFMEIQRVLREVKSTTGNDPLSILVRNLLGEQSRR
jgi:WD40 repeat protein/serine/threonine protein kinase